MAGVGGAISLPPTHWPMTVTPACWPSAASAKVLPASGLSRVMRVFSNKASADSSPTVDAVRAQFAPRLAAHADAFEAVNNAILAELQRLEAL